MFFMLDISFSFSMSYVWLSTFLIFLPTGGTEKVAKAITKNWKQIETLDLTLPDTDYAKISFEKDSLCSKGTAHCVLLPQYTETVLTVYAHKNVQPELSMKINLSFLTKANVSPVWDVYPYALFMQKRQPLTCKIYSSGMSFFPYFTIFLTHDAAYPQSIWFQNV